VLSLPATLTESMSMSFFYLVCVNFWMIRHTEAMIERLEQAGLGYRVRAQDTQETFGK
jgi:hypothetical protein